MTALAAGIITCLSLVAIDGDSLSCAGTNMRIMGSGSPNVSGVDAPETHRPQCEAERVLGEAAKARLTDLLALPGVAVEYSGVDDRWNRPLVWVRLPDGGTAGQTLIDEGLAVEWTPRYRARWCNGD